MALKTLFTNQATNATSPQIVHGGGKVAFSTTGGFGGGTLTWQLALDDVNFAPFKAYTAVNVEVFELPPCTIRAVLTGATAATLTAQTKDVVG
jgi:hypothetical protein